LGAVLVTDSGLRHRLAHGRLPPAACTRRVTEDVLICYLRLSRLAPPVAASRVVAPATRPVTHHDGSPGAGPITDRGGSNA
jgi:hypothetical protein